MYQIVKIWDPKSISILFYCLLRTVGNFKGKQYIIIPSEVYESYGMSTKQHLMRDNLTFQDP